MQGRGGWITLERGYTSTKTFKYDDGGENHVKIHTYWTQKGRLFIYELMKSDGHLPIIEQENGRECA